MTEQERIAALAAAIDRHWLESSIAQRFARCSCGGWRQEIPDDLTVPELGEHFRPFSDHVAAAILGKLPPGWCGHDDQITALQDALKDRIREAARLREAVAAYRAEHDSRLPSGRNLVCGCDICIDVLYERAALAQPEEKG